MKVGARPREAVGQCSFNRQLGSGMSWEVKRGAGQSSIILFGRKLSSLETSLFLSPSFVN